MSNNDNPAAAAQQQLAAAFEQMLEDLKAARDTIDTASLCPPPADPRTLAEGYRYLLGYLLGAIERSLADPQQPKIRRAIQPNDKGTIDNADAVYLSAEIDGNCSYRLSGSALDSRHWRGEPPVNGPRAPQYVIFELASDYAGDSGSLAELQPGSRANTATLDSSALQVDENGHFDILIAPERPAGYSGNFLCSKKQRKEQTYTGRYLTIRELFHDWENEDLLDLEILRIDSEQFPTPPLDVERATQLLQRVGQITRHQMQFWNVFYTRVLDTYGKADGSDAPRFMPLNDMNKPNALGLATGGGQSTNIYCGGVYQLSDDEALLIETRVPVPPQFMGFHLANLWGESLDFENYQSSLNAHQLACDSDGVYRWVVCHRDPGIANWVDTTGLAHGFMTIRYTYSQQPPQELWPELSVRKVPFTQLRDELPADTALCDARQRRAEIAMRQRHVQRRYRQY